jgi:predicted permease
MVAVAFVAALGAGLSPALRGASADSSTVLRDGSRGSFAQQRGRRAFVIAQVALSVLLVVTSALFFRGLQRAAAANGGFEPAGVELVSVDLSLGESSKSGGALFVRQLFEALHQLPNVETATIATTPLVSDGMRSVSVQHQGNPVASRSSVYAEWSLTEPGYFSTMRIPLLAGRDISEADAVKAVPVAVLSQSLARRLWPDGHAVGQMVLFQEGRPGRVSEAAPPQQVQIVGVVGDIDTHSGGSKLAVYAPLEQHYSPKVTIVAKGKMRLIAPDIRALLASMDPAVPITSTRLLTDVLAIALLPQTIAAAVTGSLGFVGVALVAIGIYGITAFSVTQRTREIGIRIALGARRETIIVLVMREGLGLVAGGAAIGLTLSALIGRALGGLLAGLPPVDPMAFGGTIGLFAIIGVLACLVPTVHALRISANDALRAE